MTVLPLPFQMFKNRSRFQSVDYLLKSWQPQTFGNHYFLRAVCYLKVFMWFKTPVSNYLKTFES